MPGADRSRRLERVSVRGRLARIEQVDGVVARERWVTEHFDRVLQLVANGDLDEKSVGPLAR
jgi:hypothetical protein